MPDKDLVDLKVDYQTPVKIRGHVVMPKVEPGTTLPNRFSIMSFEEGKGGERFGGHR